MQLIKKRFSATIAVALTLTIAATLMTALPLTLGQTTAKISMSSRVTAAPYLIGVNQNVLLMGCLTPRPEGYQQQHELSAKNIYYNFTFLIKLPNGTVEKLLVDTNDRAETGPVYYNCTQIGRYEVNGYYAGDATHNPPTDNRPFMWMVQEAPTQAVEDYIAEQKTKPIMASAAASFPTIATGGQQYVIGWISPPRELHRGIYYDLKFTITKPDGTTMTHVMDTDTPATASYGFVCNQAGTWKAVVDYAGDFLHRAVTSNTVAWTVEDGYVLPVPPQEPLPTGQWGFPISADYQEWYQIAGPWPQAQFDASSSNFNPYSKAPNTPHVIWRKQMDRGGNMGGETGYFSWAPSMPSMVSAQGRLYYTRQEATRVGGGTSTGNHPVLYCIDLYTGEEIYKRDLPGSGSGGTPVLEIAQRYKGDPQLGVTDMSSFSIWLTGGGGVRQINPWTGETTYYNSALPGGTYHDGAIYMEDYPEDGYWSKWDTTTRSIVWTQPMVTNIYYHSVDGEKIAADLFWKDIGHFAIEPTGGYPSLGHNVWTWNLTTGELMVNGTDVGMYSTTMGNYIIGEGLGYHQCMDGRVRALDLVTGRLAWTSEPESMPWGTFTVYTASYSYGNTGGNGQIYIGTYDGNLYAYDIATGKTNWKAFTKNTTEVGPGQFVPWSQAIIADSKVYFGVAEHTTPQPQPRGGELYCVNANTGERMWTLGGFYSGGTSNAGVSSGILWYPNRYDGCTYAFGKGPSATTVSVQQDVVAKGASVLIKGTVTDQSSGAKDTPAIADESMGPWMEYLYMQKPMPTNATGVAVLLQACGPDGTVADITHVTTDVMGHYEYLWTPPAEGAYKVLATFEGTESYWASAAETAVGVSAAPEETSQPQAEVDNTPMYFGASTAVIVAAIAIVGFLLYRKRS